MSETLIFKVQHFDENIFPPWSHYLRFAIYVNTYVVFHILPARKKLLLLLKIKSQTLELSQEVTAHNFNKYRFVWLWKCLSFQTEISQLLDGFPSMETFIQEDETY